MVLPDLIPDQIFVPDEGTLVEKGIHDELMQLTDGKYRSLSELQFIPA